MLNKKELMACRRGTGPGILSGYVEGVVSPQLAYQFHERIFCIPEIHLFVQLDSSEYRVCTHQFPEVASHLVSILKLEIFTRHTIIERYLLVIFYEPSIDGRQHLR